MTNVSQINVIEWQDMGLVPYEDAWRLQENLREKRINHEIKDRLIILEHPPVFTMGKRDCESDFVSSVDVIKGEGIDIVKCNRGGRVTYHGPGQIVCYFIIDIEELGFGVKEFVHAIEEICLSTLSEHGVKAVRDVEHPGLWIGNDKVVAVGLNIVRGVSIHGFAMNVDCDLGAYRHVIACGVRGCGVTSIAKLVGFPPDKDKVKANILKHAARVFCRELVGVKEN